MNLEETQVYAPVEYIDSVTKYKPQNIMTKNRKVTLVLKNHVLQFYTIWLKQFKKIDKQKEAFEMLENSAVGLPKKALDIKMC